MVIDKTMKRPTAGFTLVEILVTLVVMSIGMLGLSKLQLTSLRYNQNAYQRSMATQLAYDLSNRMRANKAGVVSGAYKSPTAQQNTDCLTLTGCTPAEMAAHDMYEWLDAANPGSVARQLPGASATVCLDSTPQDGEPGSTACDDLGSLYAIKIWWVNNAGDVTYRFVTSVQI
jgi:type IV pilus assembly protein PilV